MATLTIRIDEELESSLEQLAKSQHRTKSDKALPLAEAAGYLTDEDIFRDIS